MLRYFSPLFQSQFQAYANEPEKQQLIIKAVYEFQNNMEKEDFIDGLEDSVDSPKMIDDNEQLYELDAGQ